MGSGKEEDIEGGEWSRANSLLAGGIEPRGAIRSRREKGIILRTCEGV